jgi:hypothetical protein
MGFTFSIGGGFRRLFAQVDAVPIGQGCSSVYSTGFAPPEDA